MPCDTRLSILVVEAREEKRKTGWPALLLIRDLHGMPADDGQACDTSRRATRAALLGIMVLPASLHSNPTIHTGKGNLKSRTARAGILRLPSSLSWELKRPKVLAVCTSQPAPTPHGSRSTLWRNSCREISVGLCITFSKWHRDLIPRSCEDGWIKGLEMKGKKKRSLTPWSMAQAVKAETRIKMSIYLSPHPSPRLCLPQDWMVVSNALSSG